MRLYNAQSCTPESTSSRFTSKHGPLFNQHSKKKDAYFAGKAGKRFTLPKARNRKSLPGLSQTDTASTVTSESRVCHTGRESYESVNVDIDVVKKSSTETVSEDRFAETLSRSSFSTLSSANSSHVERRDECDGATSHQDFRFSDETNDWARDSIDPTELPPPCKVEYQTVSEDLWSLESSGVYEHQEMKAEQNVVLFPTTPSTSKTPLPQSGIQPNFSFNVSSESQWEKFSQNIFDRGNSRHTAKGREDNTCMASPFDTRPLPELLQCILEEHYSQALEGKESGDETALPLGCFGAKKQSHQEEHGRLQQPLNGNGVYCFPEDCATNTSVQDGGRNGQAIVTFVRTKDGKWVELVS